MRDRRGTQLSAAMLCVILTSPLAGQAVVSGTVREDSSGRVLAGVKVQLEGSKHATFSDARGRYFVIAEPGLQIAVFQLLGYKPSRLRVTLAPGDTALADVRLLRMRPQDLEEVRVTARPTPRNLREAFYERQRLGFGKFLDSAQLRRMDGRNIQEVLRGMGLKLAKWAECTDAPGLLCPWKYSAAHPVKAMPGTTEGPCFATIMLDGIILHRGGSDPSRNPPPDFSREFPVTSFDAIEYYRSTSQVPQEMGVVNAVDCGVVVLWTRRG